MSDAVRAIADAVLYEGHVLWPYRRSSVKNRQRWTFGGVYPPRYAVSSGDRSSVSAQCLVEGEDPRLDVEVRFLQVVHRQVVDGDVPVDELELDGARHLTWDEAVERSVGAGAFVVPPGRSAEQPYVRTWEPLHGRVDAALERIGASLHRVQLTIANTSPWRGTTRDDAMRRTLASAHAVLRVDAGAFVSPRETAEPLRQDGLWPVLVGEPGDCSTLLASPIILDDYPRVAPESPGDFFDGCEIDQLLVLSILGLSEEEKREIRGGDPRAREILERTEAMTREDLLRLHGTWRDA